MVATSRPVEVFMFIDALGWEIVQRTGFMKDVLPERHPIRMQFGYSCSAIPTILTGKTPGEHGHLSAFRYDPEHSPFKKLDFMTSLLRPVSFWNRGRIRYYLSKFVKKCCGITGYFQLYHVPFKKLKYMDYIEKKDMFLAGGMEQVENLRDVLDASGIKFHIADWHLNDEENILLGRDAIQNGCDFVFIYTAGLDGVLHAHVNEPQIIQQKLDWYDSLNRTLFKTGKDIHLTVFSDHGMTPLAYTVDVRAAVEETGLEFGKDYGVCYDSTMVRFNYLSPDSKEKIHKAMDPLEKHGRWLSPEDEKAYGIYRDDRYFGDEIFFMNVGIQVIPSDMGEHPLNGMHGFEPTDERSLAAVLSNVAIPDDVREVKDYFELMVSSIEEIKKSRKTQ